MPKALSGDLRERVIEAVEAGASRREAAERFEISASSAVKWLQRWRDHGVCAPKPRGGSCSVLEDYAERILALVAEQPWTPYGIELRDWKDHVLTSRRVWLLDRHKNLDSAWLDFTKQLPFPQNTASIVFTCGQSGDCAQKELHRVKVPPNAPLVKITSPKKSGELRGKVKVAWRVQPAGRAALVRYSNDAGRTWQAVAPLTQATSLEVDLARLPGGGACLFQVLVTSGIRTGMAVSASFQ